MGSPWTIPTETSNGGPCLPITSVFKTERLDPSFPFDPYYNHTHNNNNNSPHYNNHNSHHLFNNYLHHDFLHAEASVPPPVTNRGARKRSFGFRMGLLQTQTEEPCKRPKESYAVTLRSIPTWAIYYRDQRNWLVKFAETGNTIKPDNQLNRKISLLFDTCITKISVDAVVNSTNSEYSGACGVDKRIHEVGGKALKEACKNLPRLEIGNAEITPGFTLPAKYIIHTNGPCTDNPEKLKSCYEASLNLLLQHNLRTIAFPCISTGEKGFTRKIAAATALAAVRSFLERNKNKMDRIVFCLHNPKDIEIYRRFTQIYFPVAD